MHSTGPMDQKSYVFFLMKSKLIKAIFILLESRAAVPLECDSNVRLSWISEEDNHFHDYWFSPAEFSARISRHYIENRRPPLRDAYFVHKLPNNQREILLSECKPGVLIADLLVAEAELGYKSFDELSGNVFEGTLKTVLELPVEYREDLAALWPLDSAVARVLHALSLVRPSKAPTLSVVVCHCRESLDWLVDVVGFAGSFAKLFVYEKCGVQSVFPPEITLMYPGGVFVIPKSDIGPTRGDECTGYLDYIVTEYNRLSDHTLFLQADPDHHLFISYLNTVLSVIKTGVDLPFLHLNFHRHYQTVTPCMRDVEARLFGVSPLALIGTYCCAQFIVAKERILQRHASFYINALAMVDGTLPDICSPTPPKRSSHCYVLEYLWHVVFGEVRYLPHKPDDARLPLILRMKFGNENVKTRWDDVEMTKNNKFVINRTVEECTN